MRTSQRLGGLAAIAAASLLAACASNTPLYPQQQQVGTYPASSYPQGTVVQTAPAATEFGRITDIQAVQAAAGAGNASRDRAIAGGIIGAVVGNVVGKNVNNGHNRSAATVLGGAAGAAIGNRSGASADAATASTGQAYRVTVQTDQGQWRTYEVGGLGDLRVGDRVRVENGVIYRS